MAETAFLVCVFAGFLWEGLSNYFCLESGRGAAIHQAANLAVLVTIWDSIASAVGALVARFLKDSMATGICLVIVAGIAAMGYGAAILILPPGEQRGPFRTVLDCSCFFTEGYGMVFPLTWAPLLVVLTTLRESLVRRMLGARPYILRAIAIVVACWLLILILRRL